MSIHDASSPVPLCSEGLVTLQRAEDDIALEVTNGYFDMHPECYKGDPDRIRIMCKADLQHHFRFLLSAMVTATPEMFRDYALWLKEVLVSRNLSLQHPIDSFGLMKISILKRLSVNDQAVAAAVLDAGLQAFQNEEKALTLFELNPANVLAATTDYTNALVAGDRKSAESMIQQSLKQGTDLVDVSVGIVQPAMYEIGHLWQANKITVAQEHLATAISQNALARAFAAAEFADPVDKRVICACVEGNHHSLGLRMISDTYEVAGWDVTFLGADTPNSSIHTQVDMEKPDVLALSVSLPHQLLELQQLIIQLRADMGGSMPAIVVGGLAFNQNEHLGARLKVDAWYQDARAMLEDVK